MSKVYGRQWVFTLNNPVVDELPKQWVRDGTVTAVTWQKEIGENGTPHLQGVLQTIKNPRNKNGYSMKWIKDNINAQMHVEVMRGSWNQAKDYANKEETREAGPWSEGEFEGDPTGARGAPKANEKNKQSMVAVKEAIDMGAREEELWDNHFSQMVRYSKAFDAYRMSKLAKQRDEPTKLLVIYGPPGTGKSRMAKRIGDAHGGAFWVRKPKFGGSVWFDGYDPAVHMVIVLDEFDGSWMTYEEFLRLTDRYPLSVETKGSMKPMLAKMIIITSNKPPREWWSNEVVDDNRWQAAVRRMSGKLGTVRHLTTPLVVEEDDDNDNRDFDEIVDEMLEAAEVMEENAKHVDQLLNTPDEIDEDIDEVDDDDVDQDDLDDEIDENDAREYEEERYGTSQDIYEKATARLGRSGTLSGGVVDLTGPDDVDEQDEFTIYRPNKKLKRTDSVTFGLEKVSDKRWGKEPNQSKIVLNRTQLIKK